MNWTKEQAETDLMWELGSVYPKSLYARSYEVNERGEKRLVEEKVFLLVEKTDEELPDPSNITEPLDIDLSNEIKKGH